MEDNKELDSIELKPYQNEHACRINSPSKYTSFARKNCRMKHNGKCIDIIFGIKDNKSEIQAVRMNTEEWTELAARTYCKELNGNFDPAISE